MVKLGLNIDHVATIRQARGGAEPDPVTAAAIAELSGADSITVHLREDRRHINDRDVQILSKTLQTRLNLEMAATEEMKKIALEILPHSICLVPEKRQELTTEGGLDVLKEFRRLRSVVPKMQAAGIEVSLFIDPVLKQIQAAGKVGTDFVELHTGTYAEEKGKTQQRELDRLIGASRKAHELGLGVNAGHGLTLENVRMMRRVPHLVELNIGHSIVARSIFVGLTQAVREMKQAIK